jgi:hypothetical protein
MQIGAMNHPARNPLEEIAWIGQAGFDFVDFTLEPPAADPEQIDPRAIRAALKHHGLGVVAHTAYYLPFVTPFASIRAACLGEFRWRRAPPRRSGHGHDVHYGKVKFFERAGDRLARRGSSQLCQEAAGRRERARAHPGGGKEQRRTSWHRNKCRCFAST